jgi:hypothetical protein
MAGWDFEKVNQQGKQYQLHPSENYVIPMIFRINFWMKRD